MTVRPLLRRRLLQGLGLTALGLWVWGAPRLADLRQGPPRFTPIPGAAPFRRLVTARAASGLSPALIGLQDPAAAPFTGNLCTALFGDPSPLAIAYFSDINCPNCPQMEAAVAEANAALPLIRHDLPLLGPQSVLGARAILAARLQSQTADIAGPLTHIPGPVTPARLARLAADTGLDPARWQADMTIPSVTATLDRTAALAARLGIYGTPATVIGRSLIIGTLPSRRIAQIIALEQQAGPPCS